ncbi:MAG: hypothetical protein GTN81_04895 [Proteobacteria bacterium]|nr:hypothetical protein [Pseudomonadota bacterium]
MNIRLRVTGFVTIALIVLAVIALVPISAEAQQKQPSQEEIMQMMGPMMRGMIEGMMEAMLSIMVKPETGEQLATFTRNYYEALIAKGFSKDEALKIVTSVGMPSLPAMK